MEGLLFSKILHMSLIGCYSMLIVLLVRLFLRKVGRKYCYYLWMIVFINLCIPFSVFSSFSLIPKPLQDFSVNTEMTSPGIVENTVPENREGQENFTVLWQPGEELNNKNGEEKLPVTEVPAVQAGNEGNETHGELETFIGTFINWKQIFSWAEKIWLAGILLFVLYIIGEAVRLNRILLREDVIYLDRQERIVESEHLDSPFLWGVFHPTIYLPKGMDAEEREYIISHESCHRKRKDYLIKIAVYGVTILHWFNPFVWIAYSLCCRDMEISCDEAVLEKSKENIRKAYAESLLKYAAKQNRYVMTPLTFGEPSVRSRIVNVLKFRKKGIIVSVIAFLITGLVMLGLFIRPAESVTSENTVLADTSIELGEYKDYSITLLMTKGQYYTEDQTAPGGGIYKENYEGEYILQLKNAADEVVDEFSLNEDWGYEKINFPGEFALCVSDYNLDGFPDFTIGNYASSSMNSFWLYSINENEKIYNIGEFLSLSKEFSIFPEQEQGSRNIYVTVWNIALGEEEQMEYIWSEEAGRYIHQDSTNAEGSNRTEEEIPEEDMPEDEAYDYISDPIPGLPCNDPEAAGWDLQNAQDVRGERFGMLPSSPAEGTEESTYLLGNTEQYTLYGKGDYASMLLEYNGLYSEIHYPYTSNYMIPPKLLEADLDGDGINELAIKFNIMHGTGFYIDTFLLADIHSDGNLYVHQFLEEDFIAQLMPHVSYTKTADGIQALVDGQPAGYFMRDHADFGAWREVNIGSQVCFYYEENEIQISAALLFWPEDENVVISWVNNSDITATVTWDKSGAFILQDFRSRNRELDYQIETALTEIYGINQMTVTEIQYDSTKMNDETLTATATILPSGADSYDYAEITLKKMPEDYYSGWEIADIELEE